MKQFIVRQNDLRDCGACCMLSIVRFYGGNIPLEKIRLDTKTGKNGTTAFNLINAAKKYGFNAFGGKVDNIQFIEQLPCIAHQIHKNGLNHFVVILKINKNKVILMDPAKGIIKVNKKDFLETWTNIILVMKPYKQLPLYDKENILSRLFKFVFTNEKKFLINIFLNSFLIILFSVIISYKFKIMISYVESGSFSAFIFVAILFILFSLLKIYCDYKKNEYILYLNKNINMNLVVPFIEHIMLLPLNVITSRSSGEVLTRVNDLGNIKDVFSQLLVCFIVNFCLLIVTSIFLFSINSKLFLILCIISILYFVIGLIFNPIIYAKINDNIDLETEFNSKLSESVDGINTLRNSNVLKYGIYTLKEYYSNYMYNALDFNLFLNKFMILKKIIYDIGLIFVDIMGVYFVFEDKLSILSLITFVGIVNYFIDPILEMVDYIPKFSLVKVSLSKVNEFLALQKENSGRCELFHNGDISFVKVSYSYDDYHTIINEICLDIKKGERVLLRGDSGTGKSTLCQMLNKNIVNYRGSIVIDGVDLRDYSISTIRQNIRYVSQKEKIFSGSLEYNLLFGSKVNKYELNKVLKITHVDEILNKKEFRLNTMLFDGGYNISGGERQRIILARALLTMPKILILDESLSEVNENMEIDILRSISNYYPDITIIYISHHNAFLDFRLIRMDALNV